jgi:O-antigen ligase
MALRPANRFSSPRLENAKIVLLSLLTITLFLWPKYIAVGTAGMRISPYNLLILMGFAVGLVSLFYKDFSVSPLGRAGWAATILFVLLYAVRFFSDLQRGSVEGSLYYDARDFVWFGSTFPIALMLANQPRGMDVAIRAVCVSAPILVAVALIELATHQTAPSLILFNLNVDIDPTYASSLVATKMRDGAFRAQSAFQHPIVFGEVMAAILPIAIARAFDQRGRVLSSVAAASAVIGAFLSGSRAAQAALIVGVIVFGLTQLAASKQSKTWLLALIAVPVITPALLGAYDYVTQLAAGQSVAEQVSSHARVIMWTKGWPEILISPLLGHGGGSSLGLAGIKGTGGAYTIDDYYLSLLLDGGIVGVLMLALWLGAISLGVFTSGGTIQERRMRGALLAGICAILAGQKAASIPEAMSYVFFFGGLIVAGRRMPVRRGPSGSSRQLRLTFASTT